MMLLKKLKETTKKVWYYMILSKGILIISIEAAQAQKHNIYENISKDKRRLQAYNQICFTINYCLAFYLFTWWMWWNLDFHTFSPTLFG